MAMAFTLSGAHGSGAGVVTVNEALPTNTPLNGWVRLGSGASSHEILAFTSFSAGSKQFTLAGTTSHAHSGDDDIGVMEATIPAANGDPVHSPRTSKSILTQSGGIAVQRLPTDPFYYADVVVSNMVDGSRWMLGYDNSGVFTEFSAAFEGTKSGAGDFTISNVPAFDDPFLLELRTRKSSAATKYRPLKTYAYHSLNGTSIYVAQIKDQVA